MRMHCMAWSGALYPIQCHRPVVAVAVVVVDVAIYLKWCYTSALHPETRMVFYLRTGREGRVSAGERASWGHHFFSTQKDYIGIQAPHETQYSIL